jgi:hypothetical protein
LTNDQVRIRNNMERLPQASATYKRYLDKLDTQEGQVEQRQLRVIGLRQTRAQQEKAYKEFADNLTVE